MEAAAAFVVKVIDISIRNAEQNVNSFGIDLKQQPFAFFRKIFVIFYYWQAEHLKNSFFEKVQTLAESYK